MVVVVARRPCISPFRDIRQNPPSRSICLHQTIRVGWSNTFCKPGPCFRQYRIVYSYADARGLLATISPQGRRGIPTADLPCRQSFVSSREPAGRASQRSVLLAGSARARCDNVSFMGSFRASCLGISLDCCPHEVHAWVGAIRVHVVIPGKFAHDEYGAIESTEGALV